MERENQIHGRNSLRAILIKPAPAPSTSDPPRRSVSRTLCRGPRSQSGQVPKHPQSLCSLRTPGSVPACGQSPPVVTRAPSPPAATPRGARLRSTAGTGVPRPPDKDSFTFVAERGTGARRVPSKRRPQPFPAAGARGDPHTRTPTGLQRAGVLGPDPRLPPSCLSGLGLWGGLCSAECRARPAGPGEAAPRSALPVRTRPRRSRGSPRLLPHLPKRRLRVPPQGSTLLPRSPAPASASARRT